MYSFGMTTICPLELDAGGDLSSGVASAEHGEVVYLTRGHCRVAALVPAELVPVVTAAIEAWEDAEDIAAAREARNDPSIPWEQAKEQLALS